MNKWPELSLFTDSELERRSEYLMSELADIQPESAYAADLRGELHWVNWHLKTRNQQRGQHGSVG